MSYSLNISRGDLNLGGPSGISTVTGTQKLVQDLKCWLLEPFGTDPLHIAFGSSLVETNPESADQDFLIGNVMSQAVAMKIETEILRVLNEYQNQQQAAIDAEMERYGSHTFKPGEILYSVNGVTAYQVYDTLVCKVSITTGSGQTLKFAQPVGSI